MPSSTPSDDLQELPNLPDLPELPEIPDQEDVLVEEGVLAPKTRGTYSKRGLKEYGNRQVIENFNFICRYKDSWVGLHLHSECSQSNIPKVASNDPTYKAKQISNKQFYVLIKYWSFFI